MPTLPASNTFFNGDNYLPPAYGTFKQAEKVVKPGAVQGKLEL